MIMMKENKFVPKLRFKGFNEEWKIMKLGELFKISAGGDISKEYVSNVETEDFKYPIFANAKKGKGLYGYSNTYKVEGNVVTVAGRGVNLGIAHSRKEKFYPIVRLLVLKPKYECNVDYYEHRINLMKIFIESTGIPQLTAPQLSSYNISYPSIFEQNKLAEFFSSVDKKIELLEKKKEQLRLYKKGIMQKIFSQEIRFKDGIGSEFPDWEEKRLEDIFYSKKGSGLSGKNIVSNGKNKCILYGALYTKYDEVVDKVIESTNEEGSVKSQIGDILVPASTTTTGVDLANFTAINIDGVLLGGDITILRFFNEGCNIYWSYYLTHFKKYEIARFAQGSTIVHIYFSHFGKTLIKEPSVKEQEKIADFLKSIDCKIKSVSTQIEKTKEFKKGLLQQMFV